MALGSVINVIVMAFEFVGVAVMVIGFTISIIFSARVLKRGRGGSDAFRLLRIMFGSSILLGLEVLVAADLIRTVMDPSLEEAAVLGMIVLIRTVLSVSIQIEIEGVVPWKRALLQSGGQVLTETIAREVAKGPDTRAGSDSAEGSDQPAS